MKTPQRIVVLISGRGSNLQSLLQAAQDPTWPGRVVAVISNRPSAPGLEIAHQAGIATEVIDHQQMAQRADFDRELLARCRSLEPDLVVLAGFMRVLDSAFVRHFEQRLINIHPSLLPAYAGLHTHRRALADGVRFAGATVHYVTPELDGGPIIAQAAVPVQAGDDEHTLAARVLRAEHRLLPLAVGWHLRGELELRDGRVSHRLGRAQGLWWGDDVPVASDEPATTAAPSPFPKPVSPPFSA